MPPIPRVPAILLAAALAAGCRPPAVGPGAPQHTAYRGPLASSLQVEAMGDSARLRLQVTNASEAPVSVTFPSGQSFDFLVLDAGAEVWRWSGDQMFTQAVRTERIGAGETRSYQAIWRVDPARRGRTLTAVGRLTSSDHPLERTAQFRVP